MEQAVEQRGDSGGVAEQALSRQKGRTIPAGRTWPMIREHEIIGAVERIVTKRAVAASDDRLRRLRS